MDYDGLIEQHKVVAAAAVALSDAAEALARLANGTRSHVMPAPTVYEVLASIKLTCWALMEVTQFLPHGLEHSLSCATIRVTDSDLWDGEQRDPQATIRAVAAGLVQMLGRLVSVADCAEGAQATIEGQGFRATL